MLQGVEAIGRLNFVALLRILRYPVDDIILLSGLLRNALMGLAMTNLLIADEFTDHDGQKTGAL